MHLRTAFFSFAFVLLAGCAAPKKTMIPAPLMVESAAGQDQVHVLAGRDEPLPARTLQQTPTPTVDVKSSVVAGADVDENLPTLSGAPLNLNIQNVPVPIFINEVFGSLLNLNLTLEDKVASLQELVTVNTEETVSPTQMFRIGRQVLGEYGIGVDVEGDLVRFSMNRDGVSTTPPLVISGRAHPQVPITHRPVFQLIELEVVRSGDAVRWLNTLFGDDLKVIDESARNSVLITGRPSQIRQAIAALEVFDRPLMRGRISTRLEPAFLTAEQLADRLVDVMNLQGYGANRTVGSPSSVIILPIAAVNSVLVFATTTQALDYAVSWARELDRPGQRAGEESMFYYQVKNTKADEIASILTSAAPRAGAATSTPTADGAESGARSAPGRVTSSGGSILVDEPRNALIYQGDPADWERTLTLIQQMDKAPRQVMIEVTIAEVSLNDDNSFGLSWFAKNGFGRFDGSSYLGQGSGSGSPGPSSGGLTYLLDVAGQNRLALQAFANDDRVTILSRPHLLVKSGHEANIDIGTEVPTVTMQTTSDQQTDGNTNLLQSIQYRKTGIILQIKPTVYSDDRIDLEISQEVSEALPISGSSPGGSPSIFNRSLNTSLSLRDGGSVVMAGLISTRQSSGSSGIPLVKDIPILGNLFKSTDIKKSKTELVLMIVPYIVESDQQAAKVSQAIVDRLDLLEMETIGTPIIDQTSEMRRAIEESITPNNPQE